MSKAVGAKSLKSANQPRLWFVIAANTIVLFAIAQWDHISAFGLKALFTSAINLAPVSLAFVVTTLANGLVSADMKSRLVFLRWHHVLPGHRAFSQYAQSDPRIDPAALRKSLGKAYPETPEAENSTWYRLSKQEEQAPEVQYIHREFLFARDYAALAALLFAGFTATAFAAAPLRVALIYGSALLLQFLITRHVAATYGARFVCTVLAVHCAKLRPAPGRPVP